MSYLRRLRYAWPLLYVLIYFPWFVFLENRSVTYTLLHTRFDDLIPFCEYFIIPYFLWFFYVPVVVLFILFKAKKSEFYRLCAALFIGMSLCLLICTIWPNGQNLRIDLNGHENICAKIVGFLYSADTSTNVFPSIHAYNSIICAIAVFKCDLLQKKRWIKNSSLILTILICLSTMFLKQHSILDVLASIVLSAVMYIAVYGLNEAYDFKRIKEAKSSKNKQEQIN